MGNVRYGDFMPSNMQQVISLHSTVRTVFYLLYSQSLSSRLVKDITGCKLVFERIYNLFTKQYLIPLNFSYSFQFLFFRPTDSIFSKGPENRAQFRYLAFLFIFYTSLAGTENNSNIETNWKWVNWLIPHSHDSLTVRIRFERYFKQG